MTYNPHEETPVIPAPILPSSADGWLMTTPPEKEPLFPYGMTNAVAKMKPRRRSGAVEIVVGLLALFYVLYSIATMGASGEDPNPAAKPATYPQENLKTQ